MYNNLARKADKNWQICDTHVFKKPVFSENIKVSEDGHDGPRAVVEHHVRVVEDHGQPEE